MIKRWCNHLLIKLSESWPTWRHQMETFTALLALCAGNSPVTGEFPVQRPVTRSVDDLFDLSLKNGWVNIRGAGDLRRHCTHYDVIVMSCGPYLDCHVIQFVARLGVLRCGQADTSAREENTGINTLKLNKVASIFANNFLTGVLISNICMNKILLKLFPQCQIDNDTTLVVVECLGADHYAISHFLLLWPISYISMIYQHMNIPTLKHIEEFWWNCQERSDMIEGTIYQLWRCSGSYGGIYIFFFFFKPSCLSSFLFHFWAVMSRLFPAWLDSFTLRKLGISVGRCFPNDSCFHLLVQWLTSNAYCHVSSELMSGWRHQMETFSALLAICAGNSPGNKPCWGPFYWHGLSDNRTWIGNYFNCIVNDIITHPLKTALFCTYPLMLLNILR